MTKAVESSRLWRVLNLVANLSVKLSSILAIRRLPLREMSNVLEWVRVKSTGVMMNLRKNAKTRVAYVFMALVTADKSVMEVVNRDGLASTVTFLRLVKSSYLNCDALEPERECIVLKLFDRLALAKEAAVIPIADIS